MVSTVLTPDRDLSFPDFTLLRASAGSGKTRALAHRYIQFILSDRIGKNALTNILAITFSNNAAREMKERIITWLKAIHAGDVEHLDVLAYLTGTDRAVLRERAGQTVDDILDNYSDFQVRTIDSFTASIFRSSALELGVLPNTEILLEKNQLINQAFEHFFRKVKPDSGESGVFEQIIDYILRQKAPKSRYPWDPTEEVIQVFKKLYTRFASLPHDVVAVDHTTEISETFAAIKEQIKKIDNLINTSGLEPNATAHFDNALAAAEMDDLSYAIGRRHRCNLIKRGKMKNELFDPWNEQVNQLRDKLNDLYAQLTSQYARSFYTPHMLNFRNFSNILSDVKREHNQIFIDDIGKALSSQLKADIVPYVYLMLGDTVHHYLIDEFQDTSPLQWADLRPLIENSLSEGGSLFAVGDTKQAIYKFRGADFKIMKHLEDNRDFPSAAPNIKDLDTNYRSDENILRFNESFFNSLLVHDEYREAAKLSGLDHHHQNTAEHKIGKGYAESIVFSPEGQEEQPQPEKKKIIDTINDALQRGYTHRDIAVLTFRNNNVTAISSWLSEENIRFVSFSNLDVRKRKITGELISILKFLNSPTDDLAFASFCLGDISAGSLTQSGIPRDVLIQCITNAGNDPAMRRHPLYKNIADAYPDFWNTYLENLFNKAGYLSIYDLTLDIYRTFSLYENFNEEEAALTKFIEAIKDFESCGINSLSAFLDYVASDDTESDWNLDTPEKIDAVQLMTIHKAKGLGFPVVIIVLYNNHRMQEDFFIDDAENPPVLLRLKKEYEDIDPRLGELYNAYRLASIADYLNGLYVACTRAEEEMYLLGVEPRKAGTDSICSFFPKETFGIKSTRERHRVNDEKYITPYHHTLPVQFDVGDKSSLRSTELIRGELIHEILSGIDYIDDTPGEKIKAVLDRYRFQHGTLPDASIGEIIDLITGFLTIEEIRKYFIKADGRIIHTEIDIADAEGHLFRIDRLVIDTGELTAIDFKTGDDRRAFDGYEKQVRNYCKILSGIYPDKSINGILAYVDTKIIKAIV
jgi:ATP-dependent helicase/nuclease subunit A